MKNSIFSILFLFPIVILAQGGKYCPCMKNKVDYNFKELSQILEAASSPTIDLNTQVADFYPPSNFAQEQSFTQVQLTIQEFEQKTEPPIQVQEALVQQVEEVQKSEDRRSEVQRRKAPIKVKKKRKRVRLKARKKVRKYKGSCPRF